MCHVSHVTCHVSPVTCHLSHVKIYIFLHLKKEKEKKTEEKKSKIFILKILAHNLFFFRNAPKDESGAFFS